MRDVPLIAIRWDSVNNTLERWNKVTYIYTSEEKINFSEEFIIGGGENIGLKGYVHISSD